ncbi:MAG TPA: tyrosine--tRNA ligase, partial [Candidatus Bathyarchaeia archaeon]|nr:tyrosine--tRNA ligase [Candidatus Bathyarchaeia archaeon]
YHAMINNKYGGDLAKIQTTAEYFRHCFTALGVPEDKVEYVLASKLALERDYWERVLRVARSITTQRVMRALPIMGRDMKSHDAEAAAVFYPCMQAADIFEMKLDMACAGLDQRKAHILAREAGEKLGWWKPISLHTPILMGLDGIPNAPTGAFDEDPKLNQVIAAKMSKSKLETSILIHDTPEVIDRKIQKAYCPVGIVEGNPILEYYKTLLFNGGHSVVITRDSKYGGSLSVANYQELEETFKTGKLHPKDLKNNMSRLLAEKLEPVRGYFKQHPESLNKMLRLQAS